ncbi:restriction endonuclease subunit S [Stieleria neptunia]|uniref:restriction endonuclease subunit S n=1 Tax=Stieleria neptunia TaxID=2527979 RepID=UPI0018D2311F|nr:restriction endonuclease subunit S [Stieleria neptunia]
MVAPVDFPDHPHIAPDNIGKGTGRLLDYRTIAEDGVTSNKNHFFPGQIVYSKIRPYLSKVIIADFEGLCSADMYPISTPLELRYLFRYMLSDFFLAAVKNQAGNRVVLPKVNQRQLYDVSVPVPPLAEQRRIVTAIESLQARSSRAREALSEVGPLLEQFRQSVLRSAFSGRLTADWRAAHPDVEPASEMVSRIPEPPPPARAKSATPNRIEGDSGLSVGPTGKDLPATWFCTRLTRIARLVTGHTPSRKHPEYWNGGVPWIGIKDARDQNGRVIDETYQQVTKLGLANSASRLLPAGTVLVTRTTNSIGYSVILGKEMATSQDFVGWVLPTDVNPKFLMYLMLAEYDGLRRFAKGSTSNPTVYFSEVLAFHIALPPTQEQNEIVDRVESMLDTIEEQSAMLQGSESALTQLDQSILAKAFRGELVPQNPNDEPAAELLARIRAAREADTPKKKSKAKSRSSAGT